uniref:CRISPR-associated protein n=1 Tax=Parastrongyloides trichosuri TaxID=131310 RepID=A0A0N4ZUD3_PARTI
MNHISNKFIAVFLFKNGSTSASVTSFKIYKHLISNFRHAKNVGNKFIVDFTEFVANVERRKEFTKEYILSLGDEYFSSCYIIDNNDLKENETDACMRFKEKIERAFDENDENVISYGMVAEELLKLKRTFDITFACGLSYTERIANFVRRRNRSNSVNVMFPDQFINVYGSQKLNDSIGIPLKIKTFLITHFSNEATFNDIINAGYNYLRKHFKNEEIKIIMTVACGMDDDESVEEKAAEKKSVENKTEIISKIKITEEMNSYEKIKRVLSRLAKDFIYIINREKLISQLTPNIFYFRVSETTPNSKKHLLRIPLDDIEASLISKGMEIVKSLYKEDTLREKEQFYFEYGGKEFHNINLVSPITNFFKKITSPNGSFNNNSRKRTHENVQKESQDIIVLDDEEVSMKCKKL